MMLMINSILKFLSRHHLIKIRAIDPKHGNGIITCPICKNEIKVLCPNVYETDCLTCQIVLH